MFTLTRVAAAILLGLFALWLAPRYSAVYDPEAVLDGLPLLLGGTGFVIGWGFLGKPGRALWMSAYLGLQAVALTGIVAAGLAAIRDVFVLGWRRQVREPLEAVLAIPEIMWDYLSRSLVTDFLVFLVAGGLVLGVAVHLIDRLLDRRRLAR